MSEGKGGGTSLAPGWLAARREVLGYALASLALGLAVRLPTLGSRALWYDEILTARSLALDWTDLAIERIAAKHSPVYFWMLKALGLQGASEFFLRLPSAILNSLAGAVFVAVAWRLSGRIGAIVMAILYCFGPIEIGAAQDARPYGLLMFFVAVAAYGYVSAVSPTPSKANTLSTSGQDENAPLSRLAFVIATVGTIGAGLTMIGGWIAVAGLQASIIVMPRALRRRMIRPWLFHVLLTWLAIAPFAIAVFHPLQTAAGSFWIEKKYPLSLDSLAHLADQLYLRPGPGFGGIWSALQAVGNSVALLFALYGLSAFRDRAGIRLTAFVAVSIPMLLVGVSVVQSVLADRYFLPALPFLSLLTSAGASLFWSRREGPIVIAGFCGAVVLQGIYAAAVRESPDFRAVAQFFNSRSLQSIKMVSSSSHRELEIGYYLTGGANLGVEARLPEKLTAEGLDRKVEKHRRLWLLYEGSDMAIVADRLPEGLVRCDWSYHEPDNWRLVLLAKDRRVSAQRPEVMQTRERRLATVAQTESRPEVIFRSSSSKAPAARIGENVEAPRAGQAQRAHPRARGA